MEHNNYQDQMQHPNYSQELRAILRSHTTPKAFQDQLSDYHESDIADVLEQLTADERKLVYQMLDADTLSEVLPYVDTPSHGPTPRTRSAALCPPTISPSPRT